MNKSKKVFIITLTFLMLLGLSAISATDTNANDTSKITDTTQITLDTTTKAAQTGTTHDDTTCTENQLINQQEETDSQEILNNKNVEKTENLKENPVSKTYNATNFSDLREAYSNGSYNEIVINIFEDIHLENQMLFNNNITSCIINGNNHTVYGNNCRFIDANRCINLVINNLTIINCVSHDVGGAINFYDGNIEINDCNFINCSATNKTARYRTEGGAIHQRRGNMTVRNSVFINNTSGGQFYRGGGAISQWSAACLKVYNSTFIGNTVEYSNQRSWGGAISQIQVGSDMYIYDSVFINNTASQGGAIWHAGDGNLLVENCKFTSNYSNMTGAAIYQIGNKYTGVFKVNNSTFEDNYVLNEAMYILFFAYSEEVNITDCHFENHTSFGKDLLFRPVVKNNEIFISNNIYINNLLNCSLENSTESLILDGEDKYIDLSFKLNEIYNSTLSYGNVNVYYRDELIATGNVDDDECTIIIPSSKLAVITDASIPLEVRSDWPDYYQPLNTTVNLTSNTKIDIKLDDQYLVNNEVNVLCYLTDVYSNPLSNKTMIITVNNTTHTIKTDNNGLAEVVLTYDEYGSYPVEARFNGDEYYYSSSNVNTINVNRIKTNMSITSPDYMYPGDKTNITVKLYDTDGNILSDELIDLYVNNTLLESKTTDNNGTSKFIYTAENVGIVKVVAVHNVIKSAVYESASDAVDEINISKIPTHINILSGIPEINNITQITALLLTHEEKPVKNQEVNISIIYPNDDDRSNENFIHQTDDEGKVYFNVTVRTVSPVQVYVQYNGNEKYGESEEDEKLEASHIPTNIEIWATDSVINKTNDITVTIIEANTQEKITANATVRIDNITMQTEIVNGQIHITNYSAAHSGWINISATFEGNNSHSYSHAQEKFFVDKLPTNLVITVGETSNTLTPVTVVVYTNETIVNEGYVEIYNEEKELLASGNITDGEFKTNLTFETGKYHKLQAEYYENEYYYSSQNDSEEFRISPTKINITATSPLKIGNSTQISGYLVDAHNKPLNSMPVTILLNNQTITTLETNENGYYNISITMKTLGSNNITAVFEGNLMYDLSQTTAQITVEPIKTEITITAQTPQKAGQNSLIEGYLKDEYNNALSHENITLHIDDTQIKLRTNHEGYYHYNLISNESKNVTAHIKFEDKYGYLNSENTTTITFTKLETQINLNDIPETKIYNNITIKGTITDETNNPLKDEQIIIQINNNQYNTTTKTGGEFTLTIQAGTLGLNNITITYNGNNRYQNSNTTKTFNTIKINTILTVNPVNGTPGENITITAYLNDEYGNPVTEANITFQVDGTPICHNDGTPVEAVLENGIATTGYTIPETYAPGKYVIGANYPGNNQYNTSSDESELKVQSNSTVTVDVVEGVALDNVTFTAHVVDCHANPVTGGYVVFKVGGKTLTDENGTQIRTPVVNGIAQLSYIADGGWIVDYHPDLTVEATYSGTSIILPGRSDTAKVIIYKRNATVQVSAPDDYVNGTLHIDAVVHDQNGSLVSDGNIIFKLNGLSVKDVNNKGIVAKVVNGRVHLDVKIPFAYSAKKYNLTAIYSNKIYNKATGTNTTTLKAIPTYVNATVTIKDEFSKPVVTGQIYNGFNNAILEGTAVINIKFNGISYAKKVKVNNGTFTQILEGISIYKPGTHKVEITAGANSHYEAVRETFTTQTTPKYNATPIITNITRNKTITRIQAKIVDDKNNNAQKDLRITVKLNGISFLVNQTVRNGKVDVLVDTSTLKNRTYNLELVSGANTYYNAGKTIIELPKY